MALPEAGLSMTGTLKLAGLTACFPFEFDIRNEEKRLNTGAASWVGGRPISSFMVQARINTGTVTPHIKLINHATDFISCTIEAKRKL